MEEYSPLRSAFGGPPPREGAGRDKSRPHPFRQRRIYDALRSTPPPSGRGRRVLFGVLGGELGGFVGCFGAGDFDADDSGGLGFEDVDLHH